jgi:type II secretory pathway predicted ATPase ExeA
MKIRQITVQAGRCFNHPYEQYSNLRPEITLHADLDDLDDPIAAAKELQQTAETLVEDHKRTMLKSIEELYRLTERQAEARRLGDQMRAVQERLDEIRREHPEALTLSPSREEVA